MKVDPEKMKLAREARLLTQEQAAELSGVGRVTIIRLEHGHSGGQPRTIKALARVYGVGPQDLLPDQELATA